jgi:hypothetical protein
MVEHEGWVSPPIKDHRTYTRSKDMVEHEGWVSPPKLFGRLCSCKIL